MFVNDRTEIGTFPCRLSGSLYRVGAGVSFGKGAGQPHMQAVLSERENAGSAVFSVTHNLKKKS